jgi:hypothetical protein
VSVALYEHGLVMTKPRPQSLQGWALCYFVRFSLMILEFRKISELQNIRQVFY